MSTDADAAPADGPNVQPSLDDFIPDPHNARLHPDRNRQTIAASLREFGGARSIVADADGIVRAGNGTLEAAKQLGLKPRVIETDGSELVIVKRTDLRGHRAAAYALADNRSAETAQWDQVVLDETIRELQGEGFNVDDLGFSEAELKELLDGLQPSAEEVAAATGGGSSSARPTLSERFIIPPFTVLDARQGYWQDRKRQWLSIGIKSELGRGGQTVDHTTTTNGSSGSSDTSKPPTAAPGGSPRPAMKLGKDGRTMRGDGAGRPMAATEPQTAPDQHGPIPPPG